MAAGDAATVVWAQQEGPQRSSLLGNFGIRVADLSSMFSNKGAFNGQWMAKRKFFETLFYLRAKNNFSGNRRVAFGLIYIQSRDIDAATGRVERGR